MATQTPARQKTFTPDEANAMLPLLRVILRDITGLAHVLRTRHEKILKLEGAGKTKHRDEIDGLIAQFEADQEKLEGYVAELQGLGVELKDFFTGLVDFRSWQDGRIVYLCWRLGEPEVAHWHELDSGFAGRQPLETILKG